MEDQQIVALYLARSERAITESAAKYGGLCFSVARRIVPSHEDAEECVQDAYLRAWEAIPPAKPELLGAFLSRITRNLALDRVRFEARKKRGGAAGPLRCCEELEGVLAGGGDAIADRLALRQALDAFLSSLPQKNRIVFLRRYWYFQSVQEIAASLGLSRSSVKNMLLRARKALRKLLEQEGLL